MNLIMNRCCPLLAILEQEVSKSIFIGTIELES